MSVVIRMQRAGGRNYPFFRVVVADSRRARDGRFLEKVGYYNPLTKPAQVQLDQERIHFWMGRGALPSESVGVLLKHFAKANPLPLSPAGPVPGNGAASPAGAAAASSPESAQTSTGE
jgi:small subunit ribosomal protein S16